MASLFDVSLRPSEPADQEISEPLLGAWKIRRRVHGPQKVVLRDLSIEGGDQACETFRANHRINFEFLHFLSSPYRNVPLLILHEGVEHPRRIFDLGVGPLQIAEDPLGYPEGRPCPSILEGEFAPENCQRSGNSSDSDGDAIACPSIRSVSSFRSSFCEDHHWEAVLSFAREESGRPRSLSTVIGITCAGDTAGLDSHYATFRHYGRRLPGDLLDCCAAVGVHDPRKSDDGSRDGMLQAYGPDVRIAEHAAVALLL